MEIAIAPIVVPPDVLTKDNYRRWSILMRHYLVAQNLWNVVESNQLQGERENALALYAIKTSCGAEMFNQIKEMDSAKSVWDALASACMQRSPVCHDTVELYKETLPGQCETTLRKFISHGYISRVQQFLRKNPGASPRTLYLALHYAITAAQEDITHYLYHEIPRDYLSSKNGDHGFNLLHEFITKKMFSLAYDLLNNDPELALHKSSSNSIPIILTLAQTSPPFFRRTQLGILGHCVYNCIRVDVVQGSVPAATESCGLKILDSFMDFFLLCAWEILDILPPCVGTIGSCFPLCVVGIPQYICCEMWGDFRWLSIYLLCVVVPVVGVPLLLAALLYILLALVAMIPVIILFIVMVSFATALLTCVALTKLGSVILKFILKFIFSFGQLLAWFLANHIYDLKVMDAYAGGVVPVICQQLSTLDHNRFVQSGAMEAIFQAIKNGIPNIVIELTKTKANVLWSSTDPEDSKNLFACAVTHRQEEVVRFLYEFGRASKDTNMVLTMDEEGNNILHLAAKLGPHSQLDRISGAALQLQSELRWFKSLEGIVPWFYKEQKNKDGETPSQVFVREHKYLLKEAEEWMKKMAESSTVVGSLIITMMFGVVFAVPGGHNQDSGVPIFSQKLPVPFLIFIVSDAVSLFASSSSALMFLGILTSRYACADFLKSLPTKLIIGLSSLFISIATMMVAFCVALFILLQGRLLVVIPITLLSGIPVTFFVLLQFPLLVEIYTLTFSRDIFKRPRLSLKPRLSLRSKISSSILACLDGMNSATEAYLDCFKEIFSCQSKTVKLCFVITLFLLLIIAAAIWESKFHYLKS